MLIKSAGYKTSLYKMWFCYKTNNGINISPLGDTLHIENVTDFSETAENWLQMGHMSLTRFEKWFQPDLISNHKAAVLLNLISQLSPRFCWI